MYQGPDLATPDKQMTDTADNIVTRWSVRPESDGASGNGWMWVGALLVAALFIVSGYLDEETRMSEDSTVSAGGQRYASGNASPGMSVTDAGSVSYRADKGY